MGSTGHEGRARTEVVKLAANLLRRAFGSVRKERESGYGLFGLSVRFFAATLLMLLPSPLQEIYWCQTGINQYEPALWRVINSGLF